MRLARFTTVLAVLGLALVPILAAPAAAGDVAQSQIVSANPVNWTPQVLDGRVSAIVQVGNTIVAGGSFSSVSQVRNGTSIPRSNIFAFDATTGTIDPGFDPSLDGKVNALATDGTHVYVGGGFNTVNGVTRKKLVELDLNGNVVTGFTSNATAAVNDLAMSSDGLYVAGLFGKINGVTRNRLALVSPTTGKPLAAVGFSFTDPRSGTSTGIEKIALSPDDNTLVAIGNFTRVDGNDRQQIAMFDTSGTTATLANWATSAFTAANCSFAFDTYMRDVDFAPDGSYFAVVTTGAYHKGQMCDTTSRWPSAARGTGLSPTWVDYTGGDTQWSVAVTGTAIYTGGHQRWENNPYLGDSPGPGAVPRSGIAGLDPQNGVPFTWNPGRSRGVGAFALVPTSAGLWVGSDTTLLGGEYHARIGFFPLAGGTTVPTTQPGGLPGNLYAIMKSGTVVRRSFNGSSLGSPTTVPFGGSAAAVRGGFMLGNTLYTGNASGGVDARTFSGGAFGAPSAVNLYGLTNT